MALTLIKETGAGLSDANAYANAADGDVYHEAHLYASDWTAATTATKETSLVMATRLIDSFFQFAGYKRLTTQALQWPRRECPNPDLQPPTGPGRWVAPVPFLAEDAIPPLLVQSCCELARELIKWDRTDDRDAQGLKSFRLEATMRVDVVPWNRAAVITPIVQTMLSKFGAYLGSTFSAVKLQRV